MLKSFAKHKVLLISISAISLSIVIFLILFFNIPRLTYKYDKDYDGYIVNKAYGNSKKYIIPNDYKDKPIIGVGTRAFFRHDRLEEIVFEEPQNIRIISKLSFSECPKLKSIDVSYAEIIERNAFSYDYSLNNIRVSAINIGSSAFYKCESLKSIEFLEGVKTIGSLAFSYTIVEEIILPETIHIVYVDAFKYMNNLNKIIIPSSKNNQAFNINNQYLISLDNVFYGE
ncbi:MAG: leucine-rich repeat domain-containing protein [Anaeroplasma sp.]